MKKTVIIYGSSTGTCQAIAESLAEKLGVSDVMDVASIDDSTAAGYDNLILGTSTWGEGELQDDWFDGVNKIKAAGVAGKTVALFGCGDSASYPDTFCGAMGVLYNELAEANFVGAVPASDYDFSDSAAVVDGKFVGLALDDVNESDKTEPRLDAWAAELKNLL